MEEATVVTADDGKKLALRIWRPKAGPKAILHIAHGMAEHSGRYRAFAERLTDAGFAVFAGDHRGHGLTIEAPEEQGYFADQNGWRRVLDDLWLINRQAAGSYPGLPIFLFGHSMGSFMTQQFITEHGEALAGAVLCASNGKPGALAAIGLWLAKLERLRLGRRGHSKLLNKMSFGEFNKRFQPARTDFDWLSRDPAAVDAYIADPLCGFICTTGLWCDLLAALPGLTVPKRLTAVPKNLPVLVIAGRADPVSAGTRGLLSLLQAYDNVGLRQVKSIFYDGARHELLNETNADGVMQDILDWLGQAQALSP